MKLFSEYLEDRFRGKEKNLPKFFYEKEASYNFFVENKIPTVQKLAVFDSPDKITLKNIPDKFVIKPSFMSSRIGVMVMVRVEKDRYYDLFSKKLFTEEEIKKSQALHFNSSNLNNKSIIIEERIDDNFAFDVPIDYKVYTFYDQIGAILLINRNMGSKLHMDWYDSKFEMLDYSEIVSNTPTVCPSDNLLQLTQKDKDNIINFALETAKKIKLPFVSLDLYYDKEQNVKIGEVTLTPGAAYYQKMCTISNSMQEKLGQLWTEASKNIENIE